MTPAYFSDTTQRIVERLTNQLGQGVMLTGPVGIGLGFIAQRIARAQTKEVVTINPDSKGTISIDTIRELYALGRSKAGTTIFIINDADAMGREAQNALLKLLEEPVVSVHFILTTHVPERLLETIRSRISHYVVTPMSTTQSNTLLDSLKVTDPTKRAQLLFIADGLPATLIRYCEDESTFLARSLTVRDARSFLQGSREDRLIMSTAYKDRVQAISLLQDMQKLMRRGIEAAPASADTGSLETLLQTEASLVENASVRLSLTSLALAL